MEKAREKVALYLFGLFKWWTWQDFKDNDVGHNDLLAYGMGILKFVAGNMNSRKYIDTLDSCLWPVITKYMADKPWRYMDDNAPCHWSREVETWRKENNIPRFPWPAQSPDLNPSENIWLLLKNSVKWNIHAIRTLNDLREHLPSAREKYSIGLHSRT